MAPIGSYNLGRSALLRSSLSEIKFEQALSYSPTATALDADLACFDLPIFGARGIAVGERRVAEMQSRVGVNPLLTAAIRMTSS
jgi:hypothetical protein